MKKIMNKVADLYNGRFGKYWLKEKYARRWRWFWNAVLIGLFLWGFFLFLQWWSGVVDFLNYVIWG